MGFFLWQMIIPLVVPLFYCLIYKRKSLREILLICSILIGIVLFYEPIIYSNLFSSWTYVIGKIVLFIFFPILIFSFYYKDLFSFLREIGFHSFQLKLSLKFFIMFLPLMLGTTAVVFYILNISNSINVSFALLMFFESLSEEVLFRGVLFLFLSKKTNIPVAYITSVSCFMLAHPQHFFSFTMIPTLVQGILTVEVVRRSKNLLGAWFLHGVNRIFGILIFPLILGFV